MKKITIAILALILCVMHNSHAMLSPIRQNMSRFGQYARQYVPQAAQTCRTFASRPQNFGWLRNMPTYARNVNLPSMHSMRTAAIGLGGLGLGTAYLQRPELFASVKAEEEGIAQEQKSRIHEFEPFHYQSVFINDASKCPKDKNSCTMDDLTYEIKAVETPEDIRLYIKNPRLIFNRSITEGSVFKTDSTGKNLILHKSEWPGQETKLQLPERLLPKTPIKHIQISDNEIELILPKIHSRFVPSWFYAQTIDVIKPQKA